ncbi:YciI family protein [Sphingobacterium hungaricum]
MKTYLLLALLLFSNKAFCQELNPKYDSALADSLGSDDYGMKYYTFVLLKTGKTIIENKEEVSNLFKGHMENIQKLADDGKLIVAGPFGKNERNYRGIFILNVKTIEEAEVLLPSDPAIKAGLLEAEITPWYGSSALPTYLENSEKVNKYSF